MTTIRVQLGERSYDIRIVSDDLRGLGPFARERCRGSLALVVSDEHVSAHADAAADALTAAGFRTAMSVLPSGEAQKSLVTAAHLYDGLAELRADRSTLPRPGPGVPCRPMRARHRPSRQRNPLRAGTNFNERHSHIGPGSVRPGPTSK